MEELFETPIDGDIDYYDDDVLEDFLGDYFNWLCTEWKTKKRNKIKEKI